MGRLFSGFFGFFGILRGLKRSQHRNKHKKKILKGKSQCTFLSIMEKLDNSHTTSYNCCRMNN